MFMWPFSGC